MRYWTIPRRPTVTVGTSGSSPPAPKTTAASAPRSSARSQRATPSPPISSSPSTSTRTSTGSAPSRASAQATCSSGRALPLPPEPPPAYPRPPRLAGRGGVALVLGECGATVHVTGRSTVEEAAAAVTERGGRGVPARVDHTDDGAVDELFGGLDRLDVLVANVWGGYEDYDRVSFTAPLWEQPVERLDVMFRTGLRAQFTAARAAAPLLRASRGLLVCTGFTSPTHYLGSLPYDIVKAGVGRLVAGLAHELRRDGVAAVGVWPGFTGTERLRAAFAAGGAVAPAAT